MDTPKKTQVRVLISVTPAFVFFKGLSRSSGKLFRFVLGSCTPGGQYGSKFSEGNHADALLPPF
jgi:hypothetical protein